MSGLVNLKELSFCSNKLFVLCVIDLDVVWFSLWEFDLLLNILLILISNVFRGMGNLVNLNMSENNVELINDSVFFGLFLDKLFLNSNKLI